MKSYQTYSPVDFAQDNSFIRWVLKDKAKDRLFWENWMRAHPDKVQDIEEAKVLVMTLQFKEKDAPQAKIDALWDKIDQATEVEKAPRKLRPAFRIMTYTAAAALAALLIFRIAFADRAQVITAENAQWPTHELPDRSMVQLNAQSSVEYQSANWDKERRVELKGEAFFKVQRGEKFTVATPLGSIEVLGTSFNVFARAGQLEVRCFTGKVRVTAASGEPKTLTAGDEVVFENGELNFKNVETLNNPEWLDGNFPYEDATFREVFDEIERQYNVSIEAEATLVQEHYKGGFNRNWSLEKTLDEVCFTKGLRFEINKNEVLISKN